MVGIAKSVGRGATNQHDDVKTIQDMLNLAIEGIGLDSDGKIGPATIGAIDFFQNHTLGIKPDGRVDPKGATLIALNKRAESPMCVIDRVDLPAPGSAAKLKDADFASAASKLGCEVAAIQAVTQIESRGGGFLPSNRPKILFEAHVFSRLTYHAFDHAHPDISSKHWNKALYKGLEDEYPRLVKAMALDRQAGLQSASWGLFQIMGFNYSACGFGSVETYVQAMFKTELEQLLAFVEFVKFSKLAGFLKAKDWKAFAAAYNGPGYAENAYDTKIAAAYAKLTGGK